MANMVVTWWIMFSLCSVKCSYCFVVTNESIVAMLANSREFKLYVNGLLIHEETDWLSKAHFSYIPDPRIDTIHVYAGDSYVST